MLGTVVIRGATILDSTRDGSPYISDVLVEKGVISGIAPHIHTKLGVSTVDASGLFLTPGLWDTHVHLTISGGGGVAPREGGLDQVEKNLRAYLRNGVTTVADLCGPFSVLNDVRQRQSQGSLLGARLLLAAMFSGSDTHPTSTIYAGDPGRDAIRQPATPQEARADVVWALRRANYDAIKAVYAAAQPGQADRGITRAILTAIVDEAHGLNAKVFVHVDDHASAAEALGVGVDGLEHMFEPTSDTDAAVDRVIDLCLTRGAYWTTTLALFEIGGMTRDRDSMQRLLEDASGSVSALVRKGIMDPRSAWLHEDGDARERAQAKYMAGISQLPRIHARGVKMPVGSDAGPPGRFHGPTTLREMEIMQAAGVPSWDVLRSATVVAAEKYARADLLGTVEEGKIADMVLAASNPMLNISSLRQPVAVIQNGIVYPSSDLDVI